MNNPKQLNLLTPSVMRLLDSWLDEDIGRGDLSTSAINILNGSACWISKDLGVFCGSFLVEALFKKIDPSIELNFLIQDGETFKPQQKIIELKGPTKALLTGERTALNIAMHLSGIATATSYMVSQLKGTGVQLADTRKTTPGLRVLEKYATKCGGGLNHRMGLDDAVMLKENHLAWCNDLKSTLQTIREKSPWTTKIIVEAENPSQAEEAVMAGADGVLLDEISVEVLLKLVPRLRKLAEGRKINQAPQNIVLEASGIKPENLKKYAATGIDLISTSAAITKSSWIDFSMRFN